MIKTLIAEDNKEIIKIFEAVLYKKGYLSKEEIAVAEDGKKALELAKRNLAGLQLIITDIDMPEMNGYQLIEEVRKIGYKGSIIQSSCREKCESADFYLQKPFLFNDLTDILDKVYAKK